MHESTPGPLEPALRQSYRELQGEGSSQCPDAETLAALAIGESVPEKERVADHVVSCRRCAADYQILARTHARSKAEVGRSGKMVRLGISAAAVLIAALGGVALWRSYRPLEALRGGATQTGELASPPAGSTLAAPPAGLRWPSRSGAEGYRVRLFAASGQTLWESDRLATPSADLPEAVRQRLAAGQNYFWTVEVEMPLEKARLGPFSFTISDR
jgi:hypothetical protein